MIETRRRLAAILAADVAGYSRLMGDDEAATVTMLNACRNIFRKHIENHAGRLIATAGDSVLAAFDSVVEAVESAIAIQADIAAGNVDFPEDRQMRFRVGVNLGDVIEQADGTIYGDGVNVAARLESIADPGGVTLSEDAFRQVDGKIDLVFEDIGEHKVKNITRPVRAYRVMTEADLASLPSGNANSVSHGPSIAVLPFDNLSGDQEQEYFADGVAEDLITALSHIRWLRVIARNSSFSYRDTSPDIRRVGTELGA
ncbi:MAG: adenylate/guanylate cyclase domain-containing protein, partial [Alphaproteobacteria bacterium]|nr:adenylate/guanylate cyclase domain-containing protein [Alphaproteobacteria bacterium]